MISLIKKYIKGYDTMKKILFNGIFCFTVIFASQYDKTDKQLYKRSDLETDRIEKAKELPNSLKRVLENPSLPVLILGASPYENSVIHQRPELLEDKNIEFYDLGYQTLPEVTDPEIMKRWIKRDFKDFPIEQNKYGTIVVDGGVWYHFVNANPQPNPFKAVFNALQDDGVFFLSTEGGYFPSQQARFGLTTIFDRLNNDGYDLKNKEEKKDIIAKKLKELGYPNMQKNMSNIPIIYIKNQNEEDKELINEVIKELQKEFLEHKFIEAGFDMHIVKREDIRVGYVPKIMIDQKAKGRTPVSEDIMIAIKPKRSSATPDSSSARQTREDEEFARRLQAEEEERERQIREDEEFARQLQAEDQ